MGKKTGDKKTSVVKIDSSLLEEVQEFIKEKKNKFRYVNRKQFIDLAVNEYLKKKRKRK